MRRIATAAVVLIVAGAGLAASLAAAPGSGSGYEVRAIFDNASFVVPGEDVKVAGVNAGKVKHLAVTPDKKAALVLDISNAGFRPFHTDAHCTIRPQSLIGERYVECTPGTARTPELGAIPAGRPGAGQHPLALARTSSPVDIDLVTDALRLPYRQRLALIVNEFGTALAGRGDALNQAIHRANPALRQTDQVLAILARQNRTLANLASDSDAVIAPLAARRERIGHFVAAANETGQATAERSADIERNFQRLPAFLRQLRPWLADLGDTTDQLTPVVSNLHAAAPDLSRFTRELGPFSRAGTPALVTLGQAADIGRPALIRSLPSVRKLARFSHNALPVGRNLAALATSLDQTGAVERIMDFLFFQMMATNGFDGISHYLRAGLITNLCSDYALRPVIGCSANFTSSASSASASRKKRLAPQQAPPPKAGGTAPVPQGDPFAALRSLTDPRVAAQRHNAIRTATGGGRTVSPAFGPQTPRDRALDYLLGNDGR